MLRINALFEAWLHEATQGPLASWKRAALLWRLQEDEDLRCYAAELVQFSHEPEPAKGLSQAEQAWMRERLRAQLGKATSESASGWQVSWTGPALGLGVGLLVLAVMLAVPRQPADEHSQGARSGAAETLALPTLTVTVTPVASVTPGPDDELKNLHAGPTVTAVTAP